MKKSRNKPQNKGLRSALLFAFLVASIIVFSYILKTIATLKQSVYDGHHRFTIGIIREGNPQAISFYPTEAEISINSFKGDKNAFEDQAVPMDVKIESQIVFDKDSFSSQVSNLLFHNKNNLIYFDKFRLFYFIKTLSDDSISQNQINRLNISELFSEKEIQNEEQTIQIINATGEPGVANRLSRLITNMGGRIVLLTTNQTTEDTSVIEYNQESYTVKRLASYLGFKTSKVSKKEISDVTIVIGQDKRGSSKF